MIRGDDGVGRPSGLTRRRLLAGIGGVGAVGMASGLGTGAYLADRETFTDNVFGAGSVELIVNDAVTDGTLTVDVSGIDRGDTGHERFEIGAQTNPVRIWLATDCVPSDPFSRELDVDVRVDKTSVTGDYGRLVDVRDDLFDGVRLDGGCLDPEDTVLVEVYWRLPDDAADVSGKATDLTFQLYAEQCRHVAEADVVNPFEGRRCDPADDGCETCVKLGKADEIEESLAVGDHLQLTELRSGVGHEIVVTAVETKDEDEAVGLAFELRDQNGDPGPDVCAVEVKGGPVTERYEIDSPAPATREILLAPENPKNGKRYGISNVVVFVCGDGDGDDGDEPDTDPECVVCDNENVSLATLDVRYRGTDDATVSVVATKGNASGELFAGTVSTGDVFTLDGSDVQRPGNGTDRLGPEVEIAVDGGATIPIHVSCSELLAVGMTFGDDDEFEIVGATTTDGEPICGTEAN